MACPCDVDGNPSNIMMKLKLNLNFVHHKLLQADRRRDGVTLSSALFSWFAILAVASAFLLTGGAYAFYVFTNVDVLGDEVVLEVSKVTKYKGAQADQVLEQYRSKKAYFERYAIIAPLSVSATESSPDSLPDTTSAAAEEVSGDTIEEVASSTIETVE